MIVVEKRLCGTLSPLWSVSLALVQLFSSQQDKDAAMKNKIRVLRKALGLRQEDMAKELGVTRQTINAIENDKYNPTLELAMKLARFLKTPVEDIFELSDEPHKEI
jgi:putative transcriptional regulator